MPNKDVLWIGATQKSDLDIIIKEGEEIPAVGNYLLDVWIGGMPGKTGIYLEPYSIDGELFVPSDLQYVQRVAKRRIRHKYGFRYIEYLWDKELNFLNKNGSFFRKIKITRNVYR